HCSDWDSTAGACQANMTTSSSGTQYCACWTMNTRVTVDLTYTTPADKVRELNDTYGIFTGAVFRNYGTLYTGKYTGKDNGLTNRNWLWSSNTEVNLSLIGKALTGTPVYNADDDPDNDYIAQYTITVNSDHNPLVPAGSTSPITITDTLSDALTMKVTERYPFVVKAYEDASDKEGRVLTSGDYTINYDVSPASFKIEIPNPGTRKYVISYYAEILNPQMDLPYSNTATLSWEGKDQTVQTSVARLLNVTTTGETYAVSLRKVSDTNEPLAGAVFGLYDASGKEMASGTTDTTGNLTFKTIAGTGDDALVLEPYTLYYLQEKEAPTGYIRNEKKYYFSFRKYGNTDAEHTAAQKIFVESIPESIDQNDYTLIANVPLQISNEAKKYEFTLKKVDADNTETVLTNAEFILYRSRGTEGSNEYEYALLKDGTITGWTSYKNNATSITVGQNGLAEVKGITFGTYYLEEKKAPDGYNLLTEDVEIVVSLEGNITTTSADAFVSTNNNVTTLTVKNNVGYELPKTGGIGTQGYTFLGLILALAAGMLLLIRRRTNN
ncbi:MAG: SpaA isopeptide-forming pilin-related protein, partial [Lachnospiraceae bacterium]|nr:SpaA isopeptide-forming pilin-related protein [Lachnospiraceae bacterium]